MRLLVITATNPAACGLGLPARNCEYTAGLHASAAVGFD
jgi:hypothetical protein